MNASSPSSNVDFVALSLSIVILIYHVPSARNDRGTIRTRVWWVFFQEPIEHNLFSAALWLLQLAIMFDNSSAPLSVRRQSQLDQAFHQLCSLLYQILECAPRELFPGSVAHHRVGRGHITPVGFASLLFGIASTLMLIGSTAFMIGIMMMPLVATVAMVFSFIGIFGNLATPAMWSWSRGGGLDKKNGKEDCMSGIWSGRGTE